MQNADMRAQAAIGYANRLKEAIQLNDKIKIGEHLKALIDKKAVVSIQPIEICYTCSSHFDIFPSELNRFNCNEIIPAAICQYNHMYCEKCIKYYITNNFDQFGLTNNYQCLFCAHFNIENTLLLNDDWLNHYLIQIYGAEKIGLMKTEIKYEEIVIQHCNFCRKEKNDLVYTCTEAHKCCAGCLTGWIDTLGKKPVSCIYRECKALIYINDLVKLFGKTNKLYKINNQLTKIGIILKFCPECHYVVNLNSSMPDIKCSCGTEVCCNCGKKKHFGFSCFFSVSESEFEVIDLTPPANGANPSTLLEQEYLKAKYAFNQFVSTGMGVEAKSVRLIVNKPLERRYSAKKQAMAIECGGANNVDEVYIWHGSSYDRYDAIMRDGLKVGGVDYGVNVDQGKVHGYGIYSALGPDTPIGYANGTTWILGCLALKGIQSSSSIEDPQLLNNGKTHSYAPRDDWLVFFTKEQILPRFLVEYQLKV